MNWIKAILLGVLYWVLIFFEVSILMFGFNLQTGVQYYIFHYIFLALFLILCSWLYFNTKKAKRGVNEGVYLGLVFLFVGLFLDLIITVPLFVHSYYEFFMTSGMIISYLETVFVPAIIGSIMK